MLRASHIWAALLGATLLIAAGCASNQGPIYYWGSYEQLLYDMHENPGKADPGTQITKLTHDIEKAKATGKHIAPGVHGHLGYLYFSQGRTDSAAEEFALEKELYPESSHFVDGIFERMKR
jgi:hypothetical protein